MIKNGVLKKNSIHHVQLILVAIHRKRTEYYVNEILYTYTNKAVGSHGLWLMLFRCQRFCNRVYTARI